MCIKHLLISHDQLTSGLVAQFVEQRWSIPGDVGSNIAGVRFFLFLPVGPFPFESFRSEGIICDIYTAHYKNIF